MPVKTKPHQKSSVRAVQLEGVAHIPGDKSISHRALILGSLAVGETRVTGLLESSDVMHTADVIRLFGSEVKKNKDESLFVMYFRGPDNVILELVEKI